MTTNKHDRKEGRSAYIGFAKWRVQFFADSFVVQQTLVLRMKFSGENRQLLVAANTLAIKP
jgi:hypothetical protein